MVAVGVDARRIGWTVVALGDGRFAGASRLLTLQDLLGGMPDVAAVAVNLPTVLLGQGVRQCDGEVQMTLGTAGADIDLVPPRAAFETADFDLARQLSVERSGPEPSERMHALRGKVLELQQFARDLARHSQSVMGWANQRIGEPYAISSAKGGHRARWAKRLNSPEGMRRLARVIRPGRRARPRRQTGRMDARVAGPVVEGNAELSFRQLRGRALSYPPDCAQGTMERARLLREAGIVVPAELGEVGGVPVAELLDAAALAWTAFRYQRGLAVSVPPRQRWQREGDHIVAIWA
ncbi:MAG: DUF429 domain-containing protein [Deltaproteobacteria bacterium]|jgi:predicted RNase H-like nuclease|nr:DUF429 domain-containing protein [Deltaproteobacteria bacterium]MBW2530854.1 DUF429 domain-containing protein [Deltaproteobacteria bacterium]